MFRLTLRFGGFLILGIAGSMSLGQTAVIPSDIPATFSAPMAG